jgi:predicted XRE-type DNA-binding protein
MTTVAEILKNAPQVTTEDVIDAANFGNETNAEVNRVKAALTARIVNALDARGLSVRQAAEITKFAAADFSRVRGAKLERFTIDRLIRMLNALAPDQRINVAA